MYFLQVGWKDPQGVQGHQEVEEKEEGRETEDHRGIMASLAYQVCQDKEDGQVSKIQWISLLLKFP